MPVQAGQLRHRVTLQNPITTVVNGEARETFVPVEEVSARVRVLSSEERLAAAQMEETVSHAVRMRYRPDVDHHSQLLWRGRRLDVVVADPNPTQDVVDLRCLEYVD
jgi:SPP1 family predicted phage head-tail adaptor